jgi:hypothetical protein
VQCEALVRATDRFGATPLDYIPPSQWEAWLEFLHQRVDWFWPAPPQLWQQAGNCPYVQAAHESSARAAERESCCSLPAEPLPGMDYRVDLGPRSSSLSAVSSKLLEHHTPKRSDASSVIGSSSSDSATVSVP